MPKAGGSDPLLDGNALTEAKSKVELIKRLTVRSIRARSRFEMVLTLHITLKESLAIFEGT